jgi:hypothetical protein
VRSTEVLWFLGGPSAVGDGAPPTADAARAHATNPALDAAGGHVVGLWAAAARSVSEPESSPSGFVYPLVCLSLSQAASAADGGTLRPAGEHADGELPCPGVPRRGG